MGECMVNFTELSSAIMVSYCTRWLWPRPFFNSSQAMASTRPPAEPHDGAPSIPNHASIDVPEVHPSRSRATKAR